MPPKKKTAKRAIRGKFIAGALVAAALATSGWWVVGRSRVSVSSYAAAQVLDGDTFVTSEGHTIRLAGLNSPETERCGGKESLAKLTELVSGKPLYLRITFIDSYKRQVALVYTPEGSINEAMLRSGWARIEKRSGPDEADLEKASQFAIDRKLGVYSEKCLSTKPDKAGCVIKGNVHHGDEGPIYTLPGCQSYPTTMVQKDLGDRWFCTEKEAVEAGFRRSGNCHARIGR